MTARSIDVVEDRLSPALYDVLEALDTGPVVDLSGRATLQLAERLGTTPVDVRARVRHLVELGLMVKPLMQATRCYEYRRCDQHSQYSAAKAAAAARQAPKAAGQLEASPRSFRVEAASDVAAEAVSVFWRNRLIRGAINVIAGKPGLGKSALSTTIAAELSRDGHVTIIANLEDDRGTVIRPRLDAAGAETSNVYVLPPEETPLFPDDLDTLGRLITRLAASALVLDPISGFFKSESAMHNRVNLGRLANLARNTGCTIVGVHHTIKSTANLVSALDAIGGPAGGLTAAARAAYVFGPDPTDPDRRALGCVKMNGLDAPPALAIGHETFEMTTSGGKTLTASRLRFEEELNLDPLMILRHEEWFPLSDGPCADWLVELLEAGERTQREVYDAAKEAGFAQAMVRRVALDAGVTQVTVDKNLGVDGVLWGLLRSEVQ